MPQDVIAFANKNPACFMATMDNDQPRVRGMLLFSCDEKGFIFSTGKPKNMYKQLEANPKIELCFYAPS
ncbi:MAG: pyridoxamine 5'-phosphate oxidase family protein, partial [Candidatus Omnitrophica bacterium]|nr:pyridoxamine 5'-phosphate oxidase family protein [Candidatus Omnitrophota bacterium]